MGEITLILKRLGAGDRDAANELMPLVYDELRGLAAAKMARESAGHTLQPTALVHEAWLRLGGDSQPDWRNHRHFFGAAAEAMRRILIDRARRRAAARHGGGLERAAFVEAELFTGEEMGDDIIALSDALDKLAIAAPPKAELVKLRYFAGMRIDEAARALGISEATANRWWVFARAWLLEEITSSRRTS